MVKINTFDIGILGRMDATDMAECIKNKDITSQEAVACSITRAEKMQPLINAVVSERYDNAATESKKPHKGIFGGVPSYIKDLNDYAGLPTFKGSAGVTDYIPKKHDAIVNQILHNGMVVLGKSATSEYGLLPCGETLQHGETRNPWNTEYSTGGSSAGAAALVASGVVPIAHASDGGGSIRIPASCNGLVGLKPSRKRIITSMSAKAPIDIATDNCVSRTVRDTANFIYDMECAYYNPKLPKIGKVVSPNSKRLKIAVFTDTPSGVESHPANKKAVLDTAQICKDANHEIHYINNPTPHEFMKDFIVYYSMLSLGNTFMEYSSLGFRFNHFKLTKFAKDLASLFPLLALRAPLAFKRLKESPYWYEDIFKKYDVLISPVLSHPAPKIGYFGTAVDSLEQLLRLNNYVNFTPIQNIVGAPAISLPMGISEDGIPVGVQLATKYGNDKTLLELAFEIEETGTFIQM